MKVRQHRPPDTGSVVIRTRADGSDAFMLKWRTFTRTVQVTSKGEALKLLPAFVAEARSGEIERQRAAVEARNQQPTLTAWSDTFLALHVSQDPDRSATPATYRKVLRLYVLPVLGTLRLYEITTAKIRELFINEYKAGRSPRTLKLAHSVLNRCFEAAIEDGVTTVNPTPKLSKLRLGDATSPAAVAKKVALTHDQLLAVLEGCADPSLKLYVAILASCGLRPGEALGLQWRDVDHDSSTLYVRRAAKRIRTAPGEPKRIWLGAPKTRSSVRDIGVGPALLAILADERQRQEAYQRVLLGHEPEVRAIKPMLPGTACIFPSDPDTADGLMIPIDPAIMAGRLTKSAAKVGVKVSPHGLRHTSISHAIEGGLSLADTAARAGHSNVATTARTYVHSISASQRKAALIGDSLLAKVEHSKTETPEKPGHK